MKSPSLLKLIKRFGTLTNAVVIRVLDEYKKHRRPFDWGPIAVGLAAVTGTGSVSATTQWAADLPQAYRQQCAALVSRSWDKWKATMAPRFFVVKPDGSIQPRDLYVEQTRTIAANNGFKILRCSAKILSVTKRGSRAMARVENSSTTKASRDGEAHIIVSKGQSIDVWIRGVRSQLLEVSSKDLNASLYIDGKLVKREP